MCRGFAGLAAVDGALATGAAVGGALADGTAVEAELATGGADVVGSVALAGGDAKSAAPASSAPAHRRLHRWALPGDLGKRFILHGAKHLLCNRDCSGLWATSAARREKAARGRASCGATRRAAASETGASHVPRDKRRDFG